ncbi:MAG: GFA family protein [Pseudomonadota bacterium]
MAHSGGCYCGEIRYEAASDAQAAVQCHCRECQYITGGNPNVIMIFNDADVTFTQGTPSEFSRSDLEKPVTRLFCSTCGTALGTRSPARPGALIIKVGTLDDPSVFQAQAAIFTIDKQPFHAIPEGLPSFERRPG